MYHTLKKISLSFIFLNVFMFQSLMADMMFYYTAAILPSSISKGVTASPVCPPKVVLIDVDGVYNAIIDNLSFAEKDGRRSFMPELDTSRYQIDDFVYWSAVPFPTLSPLFFVSYEDVNTSYETSAGLQISQANIDSNMTWNYQQVMVENNDGNKTISTEVEGGNWAYWTDDSMTLSSMDIPVMNVKVVHTISTNEIINILENAGINLTLDPADTAQLNIENTLMDRYWWDDRSYIDMPFETFEDFIRMAAYNSSSTYPNTVLIGERGPAGVAITFAANSTGASGTLVEISSDNKLLSDNAGTWFMEQISDESEIFDVIVVDPILCGYEKRVIKIDSTGHIIYGGYDDVKGELNAEIAFSESLKEKLKAYFVENAILDVDPDTHGGAITEEMLNGKTFYSTYSDGVNDFYASMTIMASGIITRHEIVYDTVSGIVINDGFNNFPYTLEGGLIKIDLSNFGGGFIWYKLASETTEQWNMLYEDDFEMNGPEGINTIPETWFTSKPVTFPAGFTAVDTIPITQEMLTGKTFYVENYYGDGNWADYEKVKILSSSQLEYTEVSVDPSGEIFNSNTATGTYYLSDGHIVMDFNGEIVIFSLISSDSNQWNMHVSGFSNPYRTWLLTEPARFPQLP